MNKLLTLVPYLALALFLALTMGCEKAKEKAGEVKEKATEKAGEMKEKAAETVGDVEEKAAGWDACKGCHTDAGKPAPSRADLLKKFKTEKELISAAKASKNPMMSNFKKDDLLEAAAKDLGLK